VTDEERDAAAMRVSELAARVRELAVDLDTLMAHLRVPARADRYGAPGDAARSLVDLGALRGYKPDVVGLACSKVAAAMKSTGLQVAAFAAALEDLLGWRPEPDMIRAWQSTVPPPGQVVMACEVLVSRCGPRRPGTFSGPLAGRATPA
jgi:hypothetical protein